MKASKKTNPKTKTQEIIPKKQCIPWLSKGIKLKMIQNQFNC